jgi:hypothetical protein
MADTDESNIPAVNVQGDIDAPNAAVVPAADAASRPRKASVLDETALSSASPVLPPLPTDSDEGDTAPIALPQADALKDKDADRPGGARKLAVAAAKPAFAKPVAKGVPAKSAPAKPLPAKSAIAKPAAVKPALVKPMPAKVSAATLTAAKPVPVRTSPAKPVIKSAAPVPVRTDPASTHAAKPSLRAARITKPVPNTPAPTPVFKDLTMDMNANFSGFQDAMTQAQAKAQAAFEKSTSMLGDAGEFAKGNVEAMIESGKIYSDGLQEIGSAMVAEGRTAFETMTGDIKELAAAKSPADFLKIQSEMIRKNFDNAVAYGSKNSETYLKLMSDAFAPLSGRVSLAVEKARQAAPMSAPVPAPMNAAV